MVGTRDALPKARDRVVRTVVCSPTSFQDEIVTPVERSRYHSLGKR